MSEYKAKVKKLAKLYRSVPRSTLIAVYRKYKFDYELFGYDFDIKYSARKKEKLNHGSTNNSSKKQFIEITSKSAIER